MVQKGCLKDKELRMDDIMFGLTEKIFGVDYYIVKTSIYRELKGLARQIGTYLELPQGMLYLNYIEVVTPPDFYSVSTTIAVHNLQYFAKICILCTEMTDT